MSATPTVPQSPQRPANRQELYDAIRNSSKEKFILEDMKRMGFWEKNKAEPTVAEQFLQRETQLHRELNALLTEKRRVEDREALLKQLRKERLAESRRKREENKQKRLVLVQQKKDAWKAQQDRTIGYLGEGVSAGLNNVAANGPALQQHGIPFFAKPEELANAMHITVSQLRFLAYNKSISKVNHYRRFAIPKKTGGSRNISAPMYMLKDVQLWVLENILNKITVHEAAHGFVANRSIVTNATPHLNAAVVVNFDLKDFFPTITYRRVKGVFQTLGYSEAIATILALLCTEADVDEAMLDGEKWFIGNGERYLPQGAPTSPAITNILCQKMDKRLTGLAAKLGFTYTRYADDLSFSSKQNRHVNALQKWLPKIVTEEGFTVHPDKTKIMRQGTKKEVTGITVNEKAAADRKTMKKLRATLHRIETKGPATAYWGQSPHLAATLEGYANFVLMVDREKGGQLKEKVRQLMPALLQNQQIPQRKIYPKRVSFTAEKIAASQPKEMAVPVASPNLKSKPWWKFWAK